MIRTFAVKKFFILVFILPFILFITGCIGSAEDIPDFTESDTGPFMMNMTYMDLLKSKMDDPFIEEEIRRLTRVADEFLETNFEYVTDTERSHLPSNIDKNDYVSLHRYSWPDSEGRYTIVDESRSNPELYNYDRPKLDRISTAIFYLSLAYFYSENEDYAKNEDYARKATELISNWFLENGTKMNPNLNYAQIALGVENYQGKPQGIIDTIDFIKIIDSISLIYDSRYWTNNKHKELKEWFYSFSKWIESKYNPNAFCDESWCNNVATWIDAQKTIYYLFTEQEERINSTSHIQPIQDKISLQFTSVGIQRNEQSRTFSQHYFYFNLRAYMHIALMRKQRTGFDRDWQILNSPDFGGIKPSLDVVANFILYEEDASDFFNPSSGFDSCRYLEIFRPAAIAFEHPEYEFVAQQLIFNGCRNLDISLTLPPLEWIDIEEQETTSIF